MKTKNSNVPLVKRLMQQIRASNDMKSVHEGQNSKFMCQFCDNVYTLSYNLKRHINSIHPLKNETKNVQESMTFWCDICYEKFLGESLLSEHITFTHLSNEKFKKYTIEKM